MKRFVEGLDRGQSTLFPERLDDWIGEDNPQARHAEKTASVFTPGRRITESLTFHPELENSLEPKATLASMDTLSIQP